ncbi:MAG: VWA-like domain-containing protein [Bacteroidia bacterium]
MPSIAPERVSRILRQVDQVSVDLLAREPFFGHFFTGMIRSVSFDAPTMGVQIVEGQQVQLVINPDFWDEKLQDPKHRYGLIKHELLHIVFKHVLVRSSYPLKMLFNIAADIVVNQYIDREALPESPVLFEDFAALGIKRGEGVGHYYDVLLKAVHKRLDGAGGKGDKQARRKLQHLLNNEDESMDRHLDWDQFDNLPSSAKSVLEGSIDQALQRTLSRTDRHGQEYLPGPLQVQLEALRERGQAQVSWRRLLRLFTGTSQTSQLQNTIRRPSRRYGTTPGTRLVRKQRLLVAVDTSASIHAEELGAFFDEIHHLWRLGTQVHVVAIDTHIRESFPYKGRRLVEVLGRGGTSFEPVFQFAKNEIKTDGIIYFTDGFGPPPETVFRKPILWIITPDGLKPNAEDWDKLPGRKIKMSSVGSGAAVERS